MKRLLVVNPGSANGQTGKRWAEISASVARSIGGFDHVFTDGPMDAVHRTQKALDDGYECVVAVGGDGTVNEVVNGFFRNGQAINPNAVLAVIPRGTGGDFRKTFEWDSELDHALSRLSSPATEPLDVGRAEFVDHEGRPVVRYFVNVCSFGVSGLVDQEVNRRSKALGGKISFMLGSARAMMKYSDKSVRVSVDGGPMEELKVTAVSVANGRYFGGGMKVAPDAIPTDGLFDVTIWSGYTLVDFAMKSRAIYDGSHVNFPGTRTLRCQELKAEAADGGEVLVDLDGEQPGRLPLHVSIFPSAIRLKI